MAFEMGEAGGATLMERSAGGADKRRRRAALLVVLSLLCAALAGCAARGAQSPSMPSARVDRFDEARAWRLIELQLGYGQRPAGSPQLRRLAVVLKTMLPQGHFEPLPGQPELRNIVGTVPGALPAIVVGAHYDTLAAPRGFLGANNGAAGTAVVVALARELARAHRARGAPELRFVLFDGEEPSAGTPEGDPDFYANSLRGSQAYVAAHPGHLRAMVLLDYVANKGLRLPREASSDPVLWKQVQDAARTVGVGEVFPDGTETEVLDDHTPFLHARVPAVDLIDWSYPGHQLGDTLDKLSVRSVDAVGETMMQLLLAMSVT